MIKYLTQQVTINPGETKLVEFMIPPGMFPYAFLSNEHLIKSIRTGSGDVLLKNVVNSLYGSRYRHYDFLFKIPPVSSNRIIFEVKRFSGTYPSYVTLVLSSKKTDENFEYKSIYDILPVNTTQKEFFVDFGDRVPKYFLYASYDGDITDIIFKSFSGMEVLRIKDSNILPLIGKDFHTGFYLPEEAQLKRFKLIMKLRFPVQYQHNWFNALFVTFPKEEKDMVCEVKH